MKTGDFTSEIVVKYMTPESSYNDAIYCYRDDNHLTLKIRYKTHSDIAMDQLVKGTVTLKPLGEDYLTYLALSYKSSTNKWHIYMNGKEYHQVTSSAKNLNENVLLGTCITACDGKDFLGKIYAFHMTNVFKDENEILNTWNKSKINNKIFIKKIFFSIYLFIHFFHFHLLYINKHFQTCLQKQFLLTI